MFWERTEIIFLGFLGAIVLLKILGLRISIRSRVSAFFCGFEDMMWLKYFPRAQPETSPMERCDISKRKSGKGVNSEALVISSAIPIPNVITYTNEPNAIPLKPA